MNADSFDMGDEPVLTPKPTPRVPEEVIGQGADEEPKKLTSGNEPPPLFDEAAEQHVLSCLLLEPARATLPAEAFHFPAHRLLYLSIQRLHAASAPVEAATISADLTDRGQFQQVGGWPFLFQIDDREKVPTTLHFAHFAKRVLDLKERRQAKAHAEATLKAIASGQPTPSLYAPPESVTLAGLIAKPLPDFALPPASDPSILIGNRWLSRGDIAILASTSGMGKSSLSLQAATHWALQLPLFGGFQTQRPLRSLIFQAEDGDGDIAEVFISLTHAMKLSANDLSAVRERVLIVTDRIHRGLSFRAELARQIALHKPDLVWINPLLAFIGGDVNDSTDVGAFLREQLNSLNEPPQFAYIIVHHTAKPPKEKAQRQWNEVMYEMAGSADLTNAARAILSLQATQTEGEFTLVAAKRGIRAGLTKRAPQGAGFRQDPVATITVRHSKERMEVNGVSLPVIHWERGEDAVAPESIETKGHKKAVELVEKFAAKIPDTAAAAKPLGMMHRDLKDRTELTYNGFKKIMLRAHEAGALIMVERPGLGACFYRPAKSRASNDD